MEDYEWVPNLKWFEVKCWRFWLSFEGDRELGIEGFESVHVGEEEVGDDLMHE
jgi:hypothetical protein